MNDEAREYVAYLSRFSGRPRPAMPKTDATAYTDNEYLFAIQDVIVDFENVNDEYLTIKYLKGEWWK